MCVCVCVCVCVEAAFFWIKLLQLGWVRRILPLTEPAADMLGEGCCLQHTQTRRGRWQGCAPSISGRVSADVHSRCCFLPSDSRSQHPPTLTASLSLFYFQGKKKEADGDRRQAPRAGRADTSAAAFQGKQLIPRTCLLSDMRITRQRAGQSLPWVKALPRAAPAPFHSVRKPSLGCSCEFLKFRALLHSVPISESLMRW